MTRWIPILLLACSAAAHAAPGNGAYEDMDVLLNEKGLMARLGQQVQQARDTVSERPGIPPPRAAPAFLSSRFRSPPRLPHPSRQSNLLGYFAREFLNARCGEGGEKVTQ